MLFGEAIAIREMKCVQYAVHPPHSAFISRWRCGAFRPKGCESIGFSRSQNKIESERKEANEVKLDQVQG